MPSYPGKLPLHDARLLRSRIFEIQQEIENWKSQFGAMSEWLADGAFPEATEPIYSPAELEAAGQGCLL